MTNSAILNDAELHGLVDGHIDASRRADVLRRAAASPRDRMLIERWQDQADMIRAAFAGVEHEPLPSRLDLRMPPKLHAVPPVPGPAAGTTASATRRWPVRAATIASLAVGLAGSWYVAGSPSGRTRPAIVRSGVERELADRTIAAPAPGETGAFEPTAAAEPPPATLVPDLSSEGFSLTGAEMRGGAPRSLVFKYSDAGGERVAVGTSRTDGDDSAPTPFATAVSWRSGHVAYVLSGTVTSERLGAIAASLRAKTPPGQ